MFCFLLLVKKARRNNLMKGLDLTESLRFSYLSDELFIKGWDRPTLFLSLVGSLNSRQPANPMKSCQKLNLHKKSDS